MLTTARKGAGELISAVRTTVAQMMVCGIDRTKAIYVGYLAAEL